MKIFFRVLVTFTFLYTFVFANEADDYSKKGMLVKESRQQAVSESNSYPSNMPMIVEEERTYGQIEIKTNDFEKKENFDLTNFKKIYKKSGMPKVIFFVDDGFNDSIGVLGKFKNKYEEKKVINENLRDERQKFIRNKWLERRWQIQDSLTNEFIDSGVRLVDRKIIVRLAEAKEYRKGVPEGSKETINATNNFLTYVKSSDNLNIEMLNNVIEMDALNEYVDYIFEVKISSYSKYKYPTLHTKILDVKTGMYLGSVMSKNEDNVVETEEYVATNSGYQKIKRKTYKNKKEDKYIATSSGYILKSQDSKIDLENYSKEYAYKLMKKFVNGLK